MNSDEMILTIHIRHLAEDDGVTEKKFLGLIKTSVNVINKRRENNCEPYAGCPCECPINLSCTGCWARAIAKFVCIGNNVPVL